MSGAGPAGSESASPPECVTAAPGAGAPAPRRWSRARAKRAGTAPSMIRWSDGGHRRCRIGPDRAGGAAAMAIVRVGTAPAARDAGGGRPQPIAAPSSRSDPAHSETADRINRVRAGPRRSSPSRVVRVSALTAARTSSTRGPADRHRRSTGSSVPSTRTLGSPDTKWCSAWGSAAAARTGSTASPTASRCVLKGQASGSFTMRARHGLRAMYLTSRRCLTRPFARRVSAPTNVGGRFDGPLRSRCRRAPRPFQ
jgi:hypothetical protein